MPRPEPTSGLETTSGPEPTWEIATLFPYQGQWSEEEFLTLPTNRLVELSDGSIEVLPMPTIAHQRILTFLSMSLHAVVAQHKLGEVLVAPLPIRLASGNFRMPDIFFMLAENAVRKLDQYWIGADLVMEIVNPDDAERDYILKRREYAQAGIREYWIVDASKESVTVLTLRVRSYIAHGTYKRGATATSVLLPNYSVAVNDILLAADGPHRLK